MKKVLIADYESALEADYSMTISAIKKELEDEIETTVYAYHNKEDFIEELKKYDGLITGFLEIDEEIVEACPNLKCISVSGVGYSNIHMESAKRHNVTVCHIKEYCTKEVAEHTLALIFALNRNLKYYSNSIDNKKEWKYYSIEGNLNLNQQTLAVFGYGKIGKCVARLADAIGMKVIVVSRHACSEFEMVDAEEAFARADVISNHMSLTPENFHFFNEANFSKMKRKPIFINVGRGKSVDENALISALDNGYIRGAGLDVLEAEEPNLNECRLLGRDNVIVTPHSAFYSKESIDKLQIISGENMGSFLAGKYDKISEVVEK